MGGTQLFLNPPPLLSFSLKGTDQMATELLNVQQPLASPDASLPPSLPPPHRGPFTFRQILYNQILRMAPSSDLYGQQPCSPRVASHVWSDGKALHARPGPCWSSQPASQSPQLGYNDHLLTHTFLWCYPCRGFHMFTPPKQADLFTLDLISIPTTFHLGIGYIT